jgi:hypothetical protein
MAMELSDLPEAWRALSPERALALRLIIDRGDSGDRKICSVCGYMIRDPYGVVSTREVVLKQIRIICSRCDAESWREWKIKKDREEHYLDPELAPAICVCGKSLKDCVAATCQVRELPKPKLRRRSKGQRSLF